MASRRSSISSRRAATTLVITLAAWAWTPAVAGAGDIYGEIRLRDLETGKERPISGQVAITVEASNQRVETISRPGATYHLSVAEEGRFPLQVEWRGLTLVAKVGSFYHPNRYDLIIETKDDQYRLVAVFVREWHTRPQDKDS